MHIRVTPWLSTLLLASVGSIAWAVPYPTHDVKKVVTVTQQDGAAFIRVNYDVLDKMLADLSRGADSYPTQFDRPEDEVKAIEEIGQLMFVLKKIDYADNDPKLLRRAAYVYQMAHNLEIEGAAQEAEAMYKKLLALLPKEASISYQYGLFLMNNTNAEQAAFYFKRALTQGMQEAEFLLGMAYLAQQKSGEALAAFKNYQQHFPNDARAKQMIEGIEKGDIKIDTLDQAEAKENLKHQTP